MAKKLYGVFTPSKTRAGKSKFGLTYSKKQALDYVKEHGGEVRYIEDGEGYGSFDAPTFRMISLPLGEKFGVIRRSLDKKNPASPHTKSQIGNEIVKLTQEYRKTRNAETLRELEKWEKEYRRLYGYSTNPRPRKYVTVIIGQGNYGGGWEDETSYLDDKKGREEAKVDRKAYRENSQYPFRLIHRKVKIEDYEKGNF